MLVDFRLPPSACLPPPRAPPPPDLNREYPRQVFPAGPQPRDSTPSVPCRTSTTTIHAKFGRTSTARIHAKCSLPDLNRDHPRPVFPARPQPRESTPSSLPDLNRDHPRPVFPAGPQPRESTPSVPCRTSTAGENAKRYVR